MNSTLNISDDLAKLKGLGAWGLKRTHGSMFFLELGKPIQLGKHLHGEWHFLFEQSEWQIRSHSDTTVTSDDEPNAIDIAFDDLNLGQLIEAKLDNSDTLHLNFSSGHFLKVSSIPDAELNFSDWILFSPDEMCWNKKPNSPPHKHSIHEVQPEQL